MKVADGAAKRNADSIEDTHVINLLRKIKIENVFHNQTVKADYPIVLSTIVLKVEYCPY